MQHGLLPAEYFWREHQTWLADEGYMLRPRYREDWMPSWLNTKKNSWKCEDSRCIPLPVTMDATRLRDGRIVSLKQVKKFEHPIEDQIIRFFSEEPIASDLRNHCVPLYDVLQSPRNEDIMFLVMPHLVRIQKYKFSTVGEALECFRQLFEGLQFMHSHLIAHCDIQHVNVMMHPTPLLSEIAHPTKPHRSYDFRRKVREYTRTERPTRYYIIDFGLSRRFFPGDNFIAPTNFGGDGTVPEYKDPSGMSNPFPIDVYHLGNMIKTHYMQKSYSLNFMRPLLEDMTQTDPEKRPTIVEAAARFDKLCTSLSTWKLRSRFVYRNEFFVARVYRACRHVVRTFSYVAHGIPALPTPSPAA
ncbi:hypothetical protein L226DRAFT_503302 [Lentinus tigrinus ALCF2SS1-7]|uniref:uncharacterized protein n=1 Tax=Lentinus tigrinus ALCF2SS1-7 TaxID=1328758 RepID=UPI00116618DE|nr:hypothetical protein L226DRAFT_503302 [Lentinus tigrinus ALCF2SS1-7]